MNKIPGHNILTIGCDFRPPKGGIAQVLDTYEKEVFQTFHFIANSCEGYFVKKMAIAFFAYLKTFVFLLLHKQIKIVHIHTASYNSFNRSSYFVSLSRFMGRKVILHIHGGGFKEYYRTRPEWVRSILQTCDVVVALTEQWKDFYDGIGCKNVRVVHNIIPYPILSERKTLGEVVHFLYLGKICNQKGIFDLINVIYDNVDLFRGKMILHIGGNGEVDRLLKIIRDNHIEDVIRFEGWVEGKDKIELFNLSHIFILPSYTEGLPISILEALSYGVPVVATPVGGVPEIVNERNGWLFTPGSHNELLHILRLIVLDSSVMKGKVDEAKESIQNNLPSSIIQTLQGIYSKL